MKLELYARSGVCVSLCDDGYASDGGIISRMSLDDSLTVAKARERGMEGGRGREGGSIQGQENQLWPVDVVCLPHPAPPYLHALHTLR